MSVHSLSTLLFSLHTSNSNEVHPLQSSRFYNEKLSQIGWNIMNSLLINEVFLKHHLSQHQFTEVKQKLIEKISEVDLEAGWVMKRLGELYRDGEFAIINQIQEKILLIVDQIIINLKGNSQEKQPNDERREMGVLGDQKHQAKTGVQNIDGKNMVGQSLDTFASFKTFIDDFTIIVPSIISIFQDPTKSILSHVMDSSHDESVFLDTHESTPSLQHSISQPKSNSHQKTNSPLLKYFQEENIDPEDPVVFYLENQVEEVFLELTRLLHHFNLPHPTFDKSIQSDKKYTVRCTISTLTHNQQSFYQPLYTAVGRGYSFKTSKTQACKRILIQLYSQNPYIWSQFKLKKCIDGIST